MTNEFSKEEVLKNMSDMTPFLLNLLDRNKKDTFFEIMKSGLLTEKEIKLLKSALEFKEEEKQSYFHYS